MTIHPYALIIGVGIGIATFVALRHPMFAIFATIVSIILLDLGARQNNKRVDKD